jgi:SAM-dependent methyltransferase
MNRFGTATALIAPARRRDVWEREYASVRGIHSTYARDEAACFPFFREVLSAEGFRFDGRMLDVGCGRGRNALRFLERGMRVVGTDISRSALEGFRERSIGLGRGNDLHLVLCDMGDPPAFRDGFFDVVMNITTLENLLDIGTLRRYALRTAGLIAEGGYLLLYTFLRTDGYYGPLLDPDTGLVRSDAGGIPIALYSREQIESCFEGLRTIDSRRYEFPGPMYGKEYARRLMAMVMKKE